MNIDFNVTDILPDRWWDLTQNVFGNKTFDKSSFEIMDTFCSDKTAKISYYIITASVNLIVVGSIDTKRMVTDFGYHP